MKNLFLILSILLIGSLADAQIMDFNYPQKTTKDIDGDGIPDKHDINPFTADSSSVVNQYNTIAASANDSGIIDPFSGGNLDYASEGFLQAGAKTIKILVGPEGGFQLPLYLLTNAVSDVSSDQNDDVKSTLLNLFNPTAGYVNFGIHGTEDFLNHTTTMGISYQLGMKTIGSQKLQSEENTNMLAAVASLGLYFQTTATIGVGGDQSQGIFWVRTNISTTRTSQTKLDEALGLDPTMPDASLEGTIFVTKNEMGVEVNQVLGVKLSYLRSLRDIDLLPEYKDGIILLSTDFLF